MKKEILLTPPLLASLLMAGLVIPSKTGLLLSGVSLRSNLSDTLSLSEALSSFSSSHFIDLCFTNFEN
jgi:hypothetical protein